jgi:hypothetical protein
MVQPATVQPTPSTPENKSSLAALESKSAPPSPLHNTPSKLTCFLKYAQEHLGVEDATGYEDKFRAHGYGPDILHLVENSALERIGLLEGDIIRLKQNALRWWNLESESNKRKRTASGSNEVRGGSLPTQPAPRTPPNLRIRFEQQFHDGGHARLYGPRISPGTPPSDLDYEWTYFCEARGRYVPLPDGYVPILDKPVIQ